MGVSGAEVLRAWRAEPVLMVRALFHVEPDVWQRKGLEAFASGDPGKQRIALQACAGPGKSAVLAWMGWNFLLCYSDGVHYPNGYAVSITGDNLRDNLWKELSLWRERSPVLVKAFEMTSEAITSREHPTTWWLRARSFPKTANPEEQGRTLSGLHAKAILYLLDETGDMPPSLGQTAMQGLSNCEWGKIVQAGNPTSHDGLLYVSATTQAHLWYVIRITGDPEDPERSPRVGLAYAKEQIELWGRDNPWVMAYILGKFPPTSVNALLGPDEVATAMERHYRVDEYSYAQKRIGIDVARFGADSTVLFPRQGLVARMPVEMKQARSEEIAGRVVLGKSRWGSEIEFVDDTGGWGAGAIDACRLGGVDLVPVNMSGKADDSRYFNRRTELVFRMAKWVQGGGALPKHPQLARELVAYRYRFDAGKMRVEEKEEMKRLLGGKSPDFADALSLTFALMEQPGADAVSEAVFAGAGKMLSEFDPYRIEG